MVDRVSDDLEEALRGGLSALIGEFVDVREEIGGGPFSATEADAGEVDVGQAGVRDRQTCEAESNELLRRIADLVAQAVLKVEGRIDIENALGVFQGCAIDRMGDMEAYGGIDAVYQMFLEQVIVRLSEVARGRGKGAGVEENAGGSLDPATPVGSEVLSDADAFGVLAQAVLREDDEEGGGTGGRGCHLR